jgi:hypothetical protein
MSDAPTFTIAQDGQSITCHRCGLTSHNLNDVRQRWCGKCDSFHVITGPGYWPNEASGRLRPVVEAFLASKSLSADQIAIMRSYLAQWIHSPAWDRSPIIDAIGTAHLGDLRRRVAEIKTEDDLEQWLVEAEEYGFDPL